MNKLELENMVCEKCLLQRECTNVILDRSTMSSILHQYHCPAFEVLEKIIAVLEKGNLID